MEVVTKMSGQDKENEDNLLPIGIGIGVGVFALILILVIILFCRARIRKKRRSSGIHFENDKRLRKLSVKQNTLQLSYRKSDEDGQLRPTSSESQNSYQFDASSLMTRDNRGRPSLMYDSPYSTLERDTPPYISDKEVQMVEMRRKNLNKQRITSGYGQVSMISQGYTYDHGTSLYARVPDRASSYRSSVDNIAAQGHAHSQSKDNGLPNRRKETGQRHDSFRSSIGVDLGANADKARTILTTISKE